MDKSPTVAGLMRLVTAYGTERQTGQEMHNERAIKEAYEEVREYAKRLAADSTPVAFRLISPSGTSAQLTEDAGLAGDMLNRGWTVQPLVPASDCFAKARSA